MRPPRIVSLYLVLSQLLLTAGCTYYRELRPGTPAEAVEKLDAETRERFTVLTLRDGSVLPVRLLRVGADSIWFEDAGDSARRALPHSSIRELSVLHRGRGAVDGGKVGLVVGGMAGFALGAVFASVDLCLENCSPRHRDAGGVLGGGLVGACLLGLATAPPAMLLGAMSGSTVEVEVSSAEEAGRDSSATAPAVR